MLVGDADRPVRMCVCFDVTFEQLWAEGVRTVPEAQERYGCGTNCGACLPYLRRMEETGETRFAVIQAVDS